jgi:hypothetical protein
VNDPDARIRATYALDLIDALMERYGFPPPVDPAVCPHPTAEQWVLRPGRLACGDCGRVIDHPAA